MLNLYVDKSDNKIKIITDDSSIKYLLEISEKKTEFIPWQKKWGTTTKVTKIYDNKRIKADSNGIWRFSLGLGWAAYLCNVLQTYISQETYEKFIQDAILADTVRDIPFQELRDYQNEDVLHVLKYKIGLFNVYTGYGKLSLPESGKNGED